jgi:hypothetical protein
MLYNQPQTSVCLPLIHFSRCELAAPPPTFFHNMYTKVIAAIFFVSLVVALPQPDELQKRQGGVFAAV